MCIRDRIKHKYFDEAVPYIDAAVKQTKRLKQISDAAFQRQDIDEIESLALAPVSYTHLHAGMALAPAGTSRRGDHQGGIL